MAFLVKVPLAREAIAKTATPKSITEKELCIHSSQRRFLQEQISRLP
jgi:hypothetical protein